MFNAVTASVRYSNMWFIFICLSYQHSLLLGRSK